MFTQGSHADMPSSLDADAIGAASNNLYRDIPDSPFLGTVFSDFPLAFLKHRQACRVDR
ncbi:MAG: hypothetical protein RIQ83_822 [Pseudomonadota bacterium]